MLVPLCLRAFFSCSPLFVSCDSLCVCAKGNYASRENDVVLVCKSCPPRSTTLFDNAQNISACVCNDGFWKPFGGKECLTCPVNSEIVGSVGPVNMACACREDYYGEMKDNTMTCIKCDSDKTAAAGSAMCKCRKDTHYLSNTTDQTCSRYRQPFTPFRASNTTAGRCGSRR